MQTQGAALVIGSGNVKCAAAIGVARVLERAQIPIRLLVGSSGGSLYASQLAFGANAAEMERMTLEFWTADLMAGYAQNLRGVLSGEIPFDEKSGIVDDTPLNNSLRRAYGDKTFADTKIPLHIVATDVRTGEKVELTRGLVRDAARASIAIPMIWRPWEIDGRLLTDGAASNPLPVDVAIREGVHVIVALGFDLPYRARLRSFNAVQQQYISIYTNNLLRAAFSFHNLAHHAEIVPLFPDLAHISGFDTQQFPHIIQAGAAAAEHQLPYIRRLLDA